MSEKLEKFEKSEKLNDRSRGFSLYYYYININIYERVFTFKKK